MGTSPRSPTMALLHSPLLPPLSLLPTLSSMLPLSLPMLPQSTPPVDKQPLQSFGGHFDEQSSLLMNGTNSPIMKLKRQRLNKEDRNTKYAPRILTFLLTYAIFMNQTNNKLW